MRSRPTSASRSDVEGANARLGRTHRSDLVAAALKLGAGLARLAGADCGKCATTAGTDGGQGRAPTSQKAPGGAQTRSSPTTATRCDPAGDARQDPARRHRSTVDRTTRTSAPDATGYTRNGDRQRPDHRTSCRHHRAEQPAGETGPGRRARLQGDPDRLTGERTNTAVRPQRRTEESLRDRAPRRLGASRRRTTGGGRTVR